MYQIKDWDRHYENAGSRKVEHCAWCPIPNKQDGLGYALLIQGGTGSRLYAAFVATVLVCSKHSLPRNGWLTDNGTETGRPLTAYDLHLKTKLPENEIKEMLERASKPDIGWITEYPPSVDSTLVAGYKPDSNMTEGTESTEQNRTERTEKEKEISPEKENKFYLEYKNILDRDSKGIYLQTKNKKRLSGKWLETFFLFWEAYDYKQGLRAAADGWLKIKWPEDRASKNKVFNDIIRAARKEKDGRDEKVARGSTPMMAQGWITAQRWEDEDDDG